MKLFDKDLSTDFAVIAEIGVNHEGDPDKAFQMLREAAGAGADAVKFQSYTPERYVGAIDPERQARVGRFALSEDVHRGLAAEAKNLGVHFLSTPLSEDWVPLLSELGSAIKIASGDLTFEPVIRAAAQTGKPMIISVGLGTLEEIDQAVGWVRDEVGEAALPDRLVLLHCVVAYPTPVEHANVSNIAFLRERYGVTVGYSNHVIGPNVCLAAVALGTPLLEVHFTDQKEGRTFRDHALSMEAADLASLITQAKDIRAAMGTPGTTRQESELENLSAARKGIITAGDVAAGTVLGPDHIMYARPVVGFASTELDSVLGATLARDVAAGMPITPEDIK